MSESSTSTSSATSGLCLTCYAPTPTSTHPPPFTYSCCNRTICSSCISQHARLATYCPNCENAASALRKGRRNDVTRRGDVVFDLLKEQEGDVERQVAREAEVRDDGDGDQDQPPPPAYSNTFSIGDDDEDEIQDQDTGKSVKTDVQSVGNPAVENGDKNSPTWSASSKSKSLSTSSSSSTLFPDLVISSRSKSNPTDPELDRVSSSASNFNPLQSNLENLDLNVDRFTSNRIKVTKEALEQEKSNSQEERNKRRESRDQRNAVRINNAGEETRQYFLRKEDNLQKISLLFNVSIHTLLQLNQLSTPSLLHTRSFILIPSSAVEKCLEKVSDSSQHSYLSQALSGPQRLSVEAKVRSLRLATEGKFRALVTRTSHNPDEIQADERASKAYVSLVEEELKWFDFGDEAHLNTSKSQNNMERKNEKPSEPLSEEEEIEEERKDLARMNRYDSILKQAVARWEMDSEWERNQRINGKVPESLLKNDIGKGKGKIAGSHKGGLISGWMERISSSSSHHASPRQGAKIEFKA